jgi:hypothetical protein
MHSASTHNNLVVRVSNFKASKCFGQENSLYRVSAARRNRRSKVSTLFVTWVVIPEHMTGAIIWSPHV